jgi:hypothetical protein
MSATLTHFVTVFRTGQLIHLDWASNALEEADIPFQRREETSGGISLAMSAAPATGPGQWWSILVPESSMSHAREVLAALPIEQTVTPDVWSFQPTPRVKLGWQIYSWIAIGILVCSGILWLIGIWGGSR